MIIKIKNENKQIKISLKQGKKNIDSEIFPDEHNLMEKLLPAIDNLLKRNKLEINDVIRARVISDSSDSFTTTRIAKTVAKVINWSASFRA